MISRTTGLPWLIFFVWILSVSYASWFLFHDTYQNFFYSSANITKLKSLTQLPIIPPSKKVTLIHFVDDGCACSRFSKLHIKELKEQYKQVEHISITPQDNHSSTLLTNPIDWVISSPSVAVLSETGKLIYYGPYTDNAICGQGEDLLADKLLTLSSEAPPPWLNIFGYGCFCQWPKNLI